MNAALVLDSDLERSPVYASFAEFHARFAGIFSRPEPRAQAGKYLRALMGPVERRNGWQVAEAVGDARPGPTQRLMHQAVWSADAAGDRLRQILIEEFGDDEAIGVVDETGFLKKGTESVGVARQYTGTAGKVENCQIGVFISYATPKGHVLLERELYLPKAWAQDNTRRNKAKVPRAVRFHTKPALAQIMLKRSWAAGVPMRWVTGDEVYGNDPRFRDFLSAHPRQFVLAVQSKTLVWTTRPVVEPVPRSPHSRAKKLAMRVVAGTPPALTVAAVVASWPPEMWHRLVTQYGEKGPIEHDWAAMRVVECRKKMPGEERWLLARRSVSDPKEVAYYLAHAPLDTPLRTLAKVASTRYTIEQCFEEAKDDVGMDHYEVRQWPSWYRHVTLCMMALAWLTVARMRLDGVLLAAFRGVGAPESDAVCPEAPRSLEPSCASWSVSPDPPPDGAAQEEVKPAAAGVADSASSTVVGGCDEGSSELAPASAPAAGAGKKGGPSRPRRV